tara:strand:- start:73 stop:720 length:648 start_codon:yes stop_codon:yes gene_type:complete
VQAYNNMVNALYEKGDTAAAIDSLKKALKINPNYAEIYSNMGQFIAEIGQLSAAIDSFKQALKIKSDYAEAYANFSLPHLLQGSLEERLKLYEWRLRKNAWTVAPASVNRIWDGKQSLNGKQFLAYEEQGLGDMIQFCRYLPLLEHKGADVTFKVKPILHALLQTMDSNTSLSTSRPEEYKIDFETPLMGLPHLLNTSLETISVMNLTCLQNSTR